MSYNLTSVAVRRSGQSDSESANSVAWVASNVEGSYKRSVSMAMAIGFGNINGAITANIVSHQHHTHALAVLTLSSQFYFSIVQ